MFIKEFYSSLPEKIKQLIKDCEKGENSMVETNFATRGCIKYLEEVNYGNNDSIRKKNNMNFTINEEKKVVTLVAQEKNECPLNTALKDRKLNKVSIVKCHKDDDFDKYIGAALAYMYNKFGSKTAFRKWVDENAKVVAPKEKKPRPEGVKAPRPRKEKTSGKEVK